MCHALTSGEPESNIAHVFPDIITTGNGFVAVRHAGTACCCQNYTLSLSLSELERNEEHKWFCAACRIAAFLFLIPLIKQIAMIHENS
jgi:hypothetical protein